MNKKLLSLILVLALAFSVSVPAFAADGQTDAGSGQSEGSQARADGLPDVDVYAWPFMLANSYNSISLYNYSGVNVSFLYSSGIDSRIFDTAVAFIEDTRAAGYPVYVNLGHLSWEYYLCGHFQTLIEQKYGDAYHASLNELGPGCNDHQTGLAIDICVDPSYQGNLDYKDPYAKESETYAYMKEHCADYGFIVRYPEDKSDFYGIACDGAHFRYVGQEAAKYIMDNNLCLEEFMMLYGYPVHLGTAIKDGAAEKDSYVKAG